jgi:hypothetical protein
MKQPTNIFAMNPLFLILTHLTFYFSPLHLVPLVLSATSQDNSSSPFILLLSQYSDNSTKEHYQAIKAVFIYLWHTETDNLYYW